MIVIGMLEGLRSSDTGMLEIEITKGGNYWYDKDKDLILGVGGCGRKQSLMVDVVTELRCRYLKLAYSQQEVRSLRQMRKRASKQIYKLDQRSLSVVY